MRRFVNSVTTSTTVSVSPNPGEYGGIVTLTAKVTAPSGTPAGTVTFYAGSTAIGTANVDGTGVATFATGSLPVGNSVITAVYSGDSTYLTSTSAAATATVGTDNQLFVNQLYLSLLGRTASDAELAHWSSQLDNGVSRKQIVRLIARSREGVSYAVQSIFQNLLGITPTRTQINNALKLPRASATTITAAILGSRTFFRSQGGGTISGFLSALGNAVLGTELPAYTQTYFTNKLREGVSPLTIAEELLDSWMGRTATVNSLYVQYLGRDADSTGQTFYTRIIAQGFTPGQAAIDLLASREYYDLALTPDLFSTPTAKTSTKTS